MMTKIFNSGFLETCHGFKAAESNPKLQRTIQAHCSELPEVGLLFRAR